MCVIKMFAEHIGLIFTENEIIISAKRLWTVIYMLNKNSLATIVCHSSKRILNKCSTSWPYLISEFLVACNHCGF